MALVGGSKSIVDKFSATLFFGNRLLIKFQSYYFLDNRLLKKSQSYCFLVLVAKLFFCCGNLMLGCL